MYYAQWIRMHTEHLVENDRVLFVEAYIDK